MPPVLITTTTNSKEEAHRLATILINLKLAACVNIIGPVQSVYTWQGKVVNDEEYKLLIKSFDEKWESVRSVIKENHSYKVPEISLIQISQMHDDYLAWMKECIA
jgi:periplasmic divalent cation tolerance protein